MFRIVIYFACYFILQLKEKLWNLRLNFFHLKKKYVHQKLLIFFFYLLSETLGNTHFSSFTARKKSSHEDIFIFIIFPPLFFAFSNRTFNWINIYGIPFLYVERMNVRGPALCRLQHFVGLMFLIHTYRKPTCISTQLSYITEWNCIRTAPLSASN